MDNLGVVGVSYRHADAAGVARFTVSQDEIVDRLPKLRSALGVDELVYLATCNRVELWYAAPRGHGARDLREAVFRTFTSRASVGDEARTTLRAWLEEGAAEHALLVAAGLESAQAGEREIATQLRRAWHRARHAGTLGPTLDRLCADALRVSHRAHALAIRPAVASLADLTVTQVLATRPRAVALIGVSPMTRRCGRSLLGHGVPLVVVNRSLPVARGLAAELDAEAVSLDDFRSAPNDVTALVLATGSREPVLEQDALVAWKARAGAAELLIADLGVPANVDPDAAAAAGIRRIGMDDLVEAAQGDRGERLVQLAPVRAVIDEHLDLLRGEAALRGSGEHVARLLADFERIAAADAEQLLARSARRHAAGHDGPTPRPEGLALHPDELREFAATLARKLAHLPIRGVRALGGHADPEAIARFFAEARLHRHPQTLQSSRSAAGPGHEEEARDDGAS